MEIKKYCKTDEALLFDMLVGGSEGTFFLLHTYIIDIIGKNNGCGGKWQEKLENIVKVEYIM